MGDAGAVSLRMAFDIDAVANYVGKVSTEIQRSQAERDTANTNFEATFTFGGQVAGCVSAYCAWFGGATDSIQAS